MSIIKKLDSHLINQIAAGEVIESPFAVIKELVENSIDANATHIEVAIQNGGKSYISVKDNGHGMKKEDMELSLERHATSKLKDLFCITTLGFRGEALPSIASISRLSMISKTKEEKPWKIEIHGGLKTYEGPSQFPNEQGTFIEVKDIFYATPARLKFLKSDSSEQAKCISIIKKIALAYPHIRFKLWCDDKLKCDFLNQPSFQERVYEIFDEEFRNNASLVSYERERIKIYGMIAPPTLNSSQGNDQYIFTNSRPVKDKLMNMAVKLAYGDTVPSNRYPVVCLYIEVPPEDVDVNVHPTKTEVRFHDSNYIKDHIIRAIRENISSQKVSTHIANNLVSFSSRNLESTKHVIPSVAVKSVSQSDLTSLNAFAESLRYAATAASVEMTNSNAFSSERQVEEIYDNVVQMPLIQEETSQEHSLFGEPKLQIFDMFILAERGNEILMIDQHAAHERVLYERYKQTFTIKEKHVLLIPEVITVASEIYDFIKEHQALLKQTFIDCEPFGQSEIIIRALPSIFLNKDSKAVILDFIQNVMEYDHDFSVQGFINSILATLACHNAIKAGQKLNIFEMKQLLQEMSSTPHIAQCNHGRPTHIVLEKRHFEKMFLRI